MTEKIIPNDGRVTDINSPTVKSTMEGVVPKAIRTWTVFKNTNNTLEGIEALAFAMWQVALDEVEKESDNVVFMSDDTVKIIMSTLERLEQENKMIINEYNKLQAEIIGDMEFKEIMLTGITPLKVLQNLKERNRELQAFYDVHENFKTDFDTNRKLLDSYRSALEEINKIAEPRFVNGLNEEADLCNLAMDRIQTKINEVSQ
jgi:hypothetical protein